MHLTIVPRVCRRSIWLKVFAVLCFTSLFLAGSAISQQKFLYDDLFGATFPDENSGWACGRWGSIFHTSDGGTTWTKQESNTDYTLAAIYFPDNQDGWAVGDEGTIIHTADGGKTWCKQESPVPFFLMDVYFSNPARGWIVTEQTTILFTEDSGKTWTIQFQDEDFILKAISFADDFNGWTVGEYGYIYHTSDGGSTWEKQAGFFDISELDGSIVAGTFLFDVSAVDAGTAWASGIDSYITMTEDSGKTWKNISTGIPKTHFFSIYSSNPNTVLVGGNGTFVYTTDGGKTWGTPLFKPAIIYSWLYDIAPISKKTFVTVGREGIIYMGSMDRWTKAEY